MAPKRDSVVINGERRATKYEVGHINIRFTQESGAWFVTISKEGVPPLTWQTVQLPSVEASRIVAEGADIAFHERAKENVFVLNRIAKLNKKFPKATMDRIFEHRPGWTESRCKRILRRLREENAICRSKKPPRLWKADTAFDYVMRENIAIANERVGRMTSKHVKPLGR